MRVRSIAIHATEGHKHLAERGASVKVGDIAVYPHASWYADLVLKEVSGPEFDRIEEAVRHGRELRFRPGQESYAYRLELAYVQVHHHALVQEYVGRGALVDPRLAAELAKRLEALIKEMVKPK